MLTPGTRLGPYEIVSSLGAGGMGEVYLARHERLERDVAIKLLPAGALADPNARARFGSSDYRHASPLMRQVLVKAVTEDLGDMARAVRVPALFIYGDQDRDASADIGMRLNALMPQSRLVLLGKTVAMTLSGVGRRTRFVGAGGSTAAGQALSVVLWKETA